MNTGLELAQKIKTSDQMLNLIKSLNDAVNSINEISKTIDSIAPKTDVYSYNYNKFKENLPDFKIDILNKINNIQEIINAFNFDSFELIYKIDNSIDFLIKK